MGIPDFVGNLERALPSPWYGAMQADDFVQPNLIGRVSGLEMLEREPYSAATVSELDAQGVAIEAGQAVALNHAVLVAELVDGSRGWNQLDPRRVSGNKLHRHGVFDFVGKLERALLDNGYGAKK